MSGCFFGPFISDDQPINCAYEVYEHEGWGTPEAPLATVLRNNQPVDVTGTIEDLGAVELSVDIYTVDCDGVPVAHTTSSESFHHWKFTVAGANAGEILYVDGGYRGPLLPAGTCSTIALDPKPECSGMYDWSVCEMNGSGSGSDGSGRDDTVGCNAGHNGATSVLLGLALFGLSRRRRR